MAIQRSHQKVKSTTPRSPILIFTASIACTALLYLASSLISTNGFSFSSSRSSQNIVNDPRDRRNMHDKYLYWGSRIDCPGKHCETCAGLGHQESSLRCAIEEALFLKRTFVIPSRMCINPIHSKKGILHQSRNMVVEDQWDAYTCAMDSLYDLDLISITVPVIFDNSKSWHHVLAKSMKLGSRGIAHVQGVSRSVLRDKSINHDAHSGSWSAKIGIIIALFYCHIHFFLQWQQKSYEMQQKRSSPFLETTMLSMFAEVAYRKLERIDLGLRGPYILTSTGIHVLNLSFVPVGRTLFIASNERTAGFFHLWL